MSVSNEGPVLSEDQLNELDIAILDYLKEEGRATPRVIQIALEARGKAPGVRQNVNARLSRLAEHGHLNNVFQTGLYEIVLDPRDDNPEIDTPKGRLAAGKDCPWCGEEVRNAADALTHLDLCPPDEAGE